MKTVYIRTKDKFLRRKIALELSSAYICEGYSEDMANEDCALIVDLDYFDDDIYSDIKLTLSHEDGADIYLPFAPGELRSRLDALCRGAVLYEIERERTAVLRGKKIRLTELEYALFSALLNARGEFVAREKLTSDIFGDGNDRMLNLYIHYLREKLEAGNEKLIICSRKSGYKLCDICFEDA